ncbi:hypothetical protein NL676_030374 [Syzygium grande]|nr:hypothetical protein NL676_030374 [Syzygium grande]
MAAAAAVSRSLAAASRLPRSLSPQAPLAFLPPNELAPRPSPPFRRRHRNGRVRTFRRRHPAPEPGSLAAVRQRLRRCPRAPRPQKPQISQLLALRLRRRRSRRRRRRPSAAADEARLPPPYDPFSKKPVVEEPEDPKNLQEIFHKMRSEGLNDYAVKMFDALSKDGRTHEALELFGQIKDKGHMPDVVAHTAVIEAYCNAGGQSKEALKVFMRMLASGVAPNAYTYAVLVKGLAGDGRLADVKKYVMEMMGKGMMPVAATYAAVFEAFAKDQKEEEAREFLEAMKGKGFVPDEKGVREVIGSKRGPVFRSVMSILFGK